MKNKISLITLGAFVLLLTVVGLLKMYNVSRQPATHPALYEKYILSTALSRSKLHLAAISNNHKRLKKYLISSKVANKKIKGGITALHLACMINGRKCATLLIENGADVNCTDKSGNTPLSLAAKGSHPAIVKLLLNSGADTNRPTMLIPGFSELLRDSHDLRLPDWGPYTNKYAGISHIPRLQEGVRFDVSIIPGIYRRKNLVPNVRMESGYHPWETSSDLSYYSYRYELEWKDQVFADVSFAKMNDSARLIKTRFVNNTDIDQIPILHYMMNLNLPKGRKLQRIELPEKGVWINGVPYYQLNLKGREPKYQDNLMYDGRLRGETQDDNMVHRTGLGNGFGEKMGDQVIYRFSLPHSLTADLILRHKNNSPVHLKLSGTVQQDIELSPTENFTSTNVSAGQLDKGEHTLAITTSNSLVLDGFAIIPKGSQSDLQYEKVEWGFTPKVSEGPIPQCRILKFPGCDEVYGFSWKFPLYRVRQFLNSDLEKTLNKSLHSHVRNIFKGDMKAHYENIYLAPITLKANSEVAIDALVCYGDLKYVETMLRAFHKDVNYGQVAYETVKTNRTMMTANPVGKDYIFSQERMAATLLGNTYYPVYTQGRYIRHYQPGKWWLSLYTWDAGFTGIGLINVDLNRSLDLLNAYTTQPGSESAFIHHGTPVPVQIYQFLEIWNKTQSKEFLTFYYPRLKQYHEFLMGRYGTSNTRSPKTHGLIRTWDDYPPQKQVYQKKMTACTVPVANSAHAIRTAKILKMAAQELG